MELAPLPTRYAAAASAAAGGPTMDGSVRIKLRFDSPAILSPAQVQEGLSNSWFLLRPHLRSIADLAANIAAAFHLLTSCPHGISLRMENFTLPPSQPIHLLKDKDIICVNKKVIASDIVYGRSKLGDSSSLDRFDSSGPIGIKSYALDEFERESGGYESEKEEEDPQEIPHDAITEVLDMTSFKSKHKKRKHVDSERDLDTSLKKSKEKRRKHTRIERDDEQGRSLKLEATKENAANEVGRSKRKKKITQHNDKNEVLKSTVEKSLNEIKVPKVQTKEKNKLSSEGKVKVNNDATESIDKECAATKKDEKHDSSSSSSTSETSKDQQELLDLPIETESVKKPSRSSRRKKAKRFWKRENKQMLDRMEKPDVTNDTSNQVFPLLRSKIEDDGEAEEERLPIVVRPGHIRFEPMDEGDDDNVENRPIMPTFSWNDGISKRKGQSWGQEKTRRGNRNQKEGIGMEFLGSQAMESCEVQEIQYETLPSLERTPQNGDIIAYRMLELTSSMTPEVSEYRIAEVVEVEAVTGMLKVTNVPKYSVRQVNDDQPDQTEHNEEIWEVLLVDLIEIRLVEGASCAGQNNSSELEAPPKLSNPVNHIKDVSIHDHVEIEKCLDIQTCSTPMNHLEEQSFATPTSKTHTPTEDVTPVCQEISEALRKRKEELAMVQSEKSRTGSEVGNPMSAESRRQNRAWVRRAGGLGSTIALLRSQMSSET